MTQYSVVLAQNDRQEVCRLSGPGDNASAGKATIALGHSLLIIAQHVLKRRIDFQDLGPTYFGERDRTNVERRLICRLERLEEFGQSAIRTSPRCRPRLLRAEGAPFASMQ
jgi:hypothetical protein